MEAYRPPHFLENRLIDGKEVMRLTRRQRFTPPGIVLVLISVRGWVNPSNIVRLEGLSKLKRKVNLPQRKSNLRLSDCGIVSQTTMLPRVSQRKTHKGKWTTALHRFCICSRKSRQPPPPNTYNRRVASSETASTSSRPKYVYWKFVL
jgi:hypothetical protein